MKNNIYRAHWENNLRTCRMGLMLSKLEKDRFKFLAEKEHFSTLSQYIRHRCLYQTITNSELVDKLMIMIGKEFLKEYLKYYPKQEEKIYSEDTLVKPRIISETLNYNVIKLNTKKENKIKVERTLHTGFLLSEEEKVHIKINASNSGFKTVSKYIRDRCLKEQINTNELIIILTSFIISRLTEFSVGSDRNLLWRKEKIKNQLNLSPMLEGFSKEKKEKLKNSIKELTDTYSKEIQKELSLILLTQRQKLEAAIAC